MMDFNDDGPAAEWLSLLEQAEANAETDFEIRVAQQLIEESGLFALASRQGQVALTP